MDVAPPQLRSEPQRDRNRVVGLLIMGTGVPAGRIIGAGHPTTRQTQPQLGPDVPAGQAFQAVGRVHRDTASTGGGDMPTGAPVNMACTQAASSRHQGPFPTVHYAGCGHYESTAPADPGK